MKCYCCSTKKKIFESFAELDTLEGKLYLCSVCNDLLYKIRDDVESGSKSLYKKHTKELQARKKNSQESYNQWESGFLKKNKL